jgi:hypothetical protein
VIRRVSVPVAGNAKVIPPDGRDHDGQWHWEVLNPTGSGGAVELVDDPSKALGTGKPLAAGAAHGPVLAKNDSVWALGPASGSPVVVIVTGVQAGE